MRNNRRGENPGSPPLFFAYPSVDPILFFLPTCGLSTALLLFLLAPLLIDKTGVMGNWEDLEFGGPQPPQVNIDKWERAVNENDPSILTTEDRLRMLRRWPLQDANYFCNFYVGLGIDELIKKAAGTDELTEAEAIIILNAPFGDCTPEDQKEMTNQSRWSQNTKKKFYDALNLVLTEMDTERRARANAEVAFERVKAIRRAHLKNFSKDDLKNITGCNKLPWVKALKKHLEQQPAWGFVCIRTSFGDESAWLKFQEFLIHATESALVFPRNFPSIRPRWKIQWVEDSSVDGASVIDLCRQVFPLLGQTLFSPSSRTNTKQVFNSKYFVLSTLSTTN